MTSLDPIQVPFTRRRMGTGCPGSWLQHSLTSWPSSQEGSQDSQPPTVRACCFPLAHLFPRPSWALWWDFLAGVTFASRLCIHTSRQTVPWLVNAPSEQDLQPRCPLARVQAPAAPPCFRGTPFVPLTAPRPTHLDASDPQGQLLQGAACRCPAAGARLLHVCPGSACGRGSGGDRAGEQGGPEGRHRPGGAAVKFAACRDLQFSAPERAAARR